MKKIICLYLTFVLVLTGCGNLKSQIKGNSNIDSSADQPTGKIINSDNNEIIEKEEIKRPANGLDGNGSSSQGKDEKTPSKEAELTWQDKAKKYAGDVGHFLYEHKELAYFAAIAVTYLLWSERVFQQQNHQAQMQQQLQNHLLQIEHLQQVQQPQDQIQQLQQLQNHFVQAQFYLQQLHQDPDLVQQFQQIQAQIQDGIVQLQAQAQVQQQILQPQQAELPQLA